VGKTGRGSRLYRKPSRFRPGNWARSFSSTSPPGQAATPRSIPRLYHRGVGASSANFYAATARPRRAAGFKRPPAFPSTAATGRCGPLSRASGYERHSRCSFFSDVFCARCAVCEGRRFSSPRLLRHHLEQPLPSPTCSTPALRRAAAFPPLIPPIRAAGWPPLEEGRPRLPSSWAQPLQHPQAAARPKRLKLCFRYLGAFSCGISALGQPDASRPMPSAGRVASPR